MWWTAFINFRTSFIKSFYSFLLWPKTFRRLVVPSLQTVKVLRHDSVRELLQLVWLTRRFFWFGLLFFLFRSSGVVRNYQAKLIRDFLPLGVMQKQMKSTLVNLSFTWTITEKISFPRKKISRLRPSHISPAEHTVN